MVPLIHAIGDAMQRVAMSVAASFGRLIRSLVLAPIHRRHASILRTLDDRTLADIGLERRQLAAYVRCAERRMTFRGGDR